VAGDDLAGDRQAEAGAGCGPAVGLVGFVESFPDERQVFAGDTATGVGHPQAHLAAVADDADRDFAAGRRELEGVVDEDEQQLGQAVAVAVDSRVAVRLQG
jgi:hypothetical protein